jgi:hypothetical protein
VLDTYLDPSASGELYVAAPDEGENINFSAQITDLDGDPLTILWSVKSGPDPMMSADAGDLWPDPADNTWVAWNHTVEGKYYVNVMVEDGNGGSAAFQFNVYVSRGFGELQVDLEFNTFPTIGIDAFVSHGDLRDLSDTVVALEATTLVDPDGDVIAPTLWTTDCAAAIAGDPTATAIVLIPIIVEQCTATFTACDPIGCNQATLGMDINCATLASDFDTFDPYTQPYNDCAISCEPDPAAHECLTSGWDCRMGLNSCGALESCGACGDPLVEQCIPDGTGGTCQPCAIVGTPCAGLNCGTVDAATTCSGVTVPVSCGACTDQKCEANLCVDYTIWACENTMSGQAACSDWLESDGWDLAGAEFQCEDLTDPTTAWAVVVADATTVCINQAQDPLSPYHAADDGRCKSTIALAGYLMYAYSGGLSGGFVCGSYIGIWQAPVSAWDPMY